MRRAGGPAAWCWEATRVGPAALLHTGRRNRRPGCRLVPRSAMPALACHAQRRHDLKPVMLDIHHAIAPGAAMRWQTTVTSMRFIMHVVLNWQIEHVNVIHDCGEDSFERACSFVTCTCSMSARRGI